LNLRQFFGIIRTIILKSLQTLNYALSVKMNERRNQARIKVNWPIQIRTGNRSIEGIAKNVTLKGLFVSCLEALSMKENISISLLPPSCKPINIVGKIVWSDSYALDMNYNNVPVCIGLSFVEIPLKNRHILKEIIGTPVE
jgi:hypothetical protein